MEQSEAEAPILEPVQEQFSIPIHTRLIRWILRPIFKAIFLLLMRVQLRGLENIPSQGPYLIAINHVSLYDPPFSLAFWPVPPEAAGAVDLWDKPGISLLDAIIWRHPGPSRTV